MGKKMQIVDKNVEKQLEELTKDVQVIDAARLVLGARLGRVSTRLKASMNGEEEGPEPVHQLRVATRRAEAALGIFAAYMRRKDHRRFLKALGRVRSAASVARDLDIHRHMLAECRVAIGEAGANWFLCLDQSLGKERIDAQMRLALVAAKCGTRLDRGGTRAVDRLKYRNDEDTESASLKQMGDRVIPEALATLLQAGQTQLDDAAALHRLRLESKRLRYTLEVFFGCYDPELHEVVYPRIVELQTVLGRVNDWHSLATCISAQMATVRRGLGRRARVSLDSWKVRLDRHCTEESDRNRNEFNSLWEQWTAGEFRERFETVLGLQVSAVGSLG